MSYPSDLWQLVFADDCQWLATGPDKHLVLLEALFLWVLVGTPFSWKKSAGGLEVDWIGFWSDYTRFAIGISGRRAAWLIRWLGDTLSAKKILVRGLVEALGRLGFAAGPLEWLRPFFAPSTPGLQQCLTVLA